MAKGQARTEESEFVFFALNVGDLDDEWRRFRLSVDDIARLNPNTGTMAVFRSQRDAVITKKIYRRVPVLIKETPVENPWSSTFRQGLFNMTSDSGKFHTAEELMARGFALEGNHFIRGVERYFPLYEAKLFHHFNHRYNTFAGISGKELFHVKAFAPEMSEAELERSLQLTFAKVLGKSRRCTRGDFISRFAKISYSVS